eukprot:1139797-Pelagomonas_calceolata.AAC.6
MPKTLPWALDSKAVLKTRAQLQSFACKPHYLKHVLLSTAELAMLMEEAKSLPQETASSITAMSDGHDLNTTHRTDYTPKDMSQNRCVVPISKARKHHLSYQSLNEFSATQSLQP